MSERAPEADKTGIALDYELDAPPQKVWRALSTPELRDIWLPDSALADPEAMPVADGETLCYRMRERTPPFLESIVTFQIAPNDTGGTRLTVIHEPSDPQFGRLTSASASANTNGPPLARAA